MKVQTKRGELDWKKQQGRFHKLGILKNTDASTRPASISIVSAGDAMEESDYLKAVVYIPRAIEVSFLRRTQVLQ